MYKLLCLLYLLGGELKETKQRGYLSVVCVALQRRKKLQEVERTGALLCCLFENSFLCCGNDCLINEGIFYVLVEHLLSTVWGQKENILFFEILNSVFFRRLVLF